MNPRFRGLARTCAVATILLLFSADTAFGYRTHGPLDVGQQIDRSQFQRDRNDDGADDFFVLGADKSMNCPRECRVSLEDGYQKIEIKDVGGNVGDVGVRRLYKARSRHVYRAALWVKVSGTEDFYARLTIAAYREGGVQPNNLECDSSTNDTGGEFVKLVIGDDSDEQGGPSGCVMPRRTRSVWFKFRANAGTEADHGTIVIDRVWLARCPNDTDGRPDASGSEDGGCRASEDAPS